MEERELIAELLHWKTFRFIGQQDLRGVFEGTLTQESEEAIADIILKAGYQRIPELKLLSDDEIRHHCMGENIYYAGKEAENASDNPEYLMPMFRNITRAQLAKDRKAIEGESDKE